MIDCFWVIDNNMFNLMSYMNSEIYRFEGDEFHAVFYLLTSVSGYAKKKVTFSNLCDFPYFIF